MHPEEEVTIFSAMSALAAKHNAINLSQGFPDFDIDPALAAFLHDAATKGFNQYAPMAGLPMLRNAIAKDIETRYHIAIDAEAEITITPGATYCIFTAFASFLKKEDEVIVLEPAYDSYIPNILQAGAIPVCIPLQAPQFSVDWSRVKQAITPRTKAIIINTPHNPTGTVWQQADWDALTEIVAHTDIKILSDEVYEQLVFDGCKHISILQQKDLRKRSFAIFSFGKVFNNTGWKVGYVIAPPALTKTFRKLHQYLAFSVNTPAQYALAQYLQYPQKPNVATTMQAKRDVFLGLMAQLPFTIHQSAAGSYFQVAGYENFSSLPDRAFAIWLTETFGVATIPLSPFYQNRQDDKLIRFCFAKQEKTLQQAAERMKGI